MPWFVASLAYESEAAWRDVDRYVIVGPAREPSAPLVRDDPGCFQAALDQVCAVGRMMTSPTSMSSGCSIA